MRQNFNLLCAILNQNMFVPFCVLFRCLLALVRKTKLKEKSEKRLKCQRHSFIQQLQKLEQKSKKSFQVVIFFFPSRTILGISISHTNITLSQNHIGFTADNNSACVCNFQVFTKMSIVQYLDVSLFAFSSLAL